MKKIFAAIALLLASSFLFAQTDSALRYRILSRTFTEVNTTKVLVY